MAFGREHINVSQIMGSSRLGPLVPDSQSAASTNSDALLRAIQSLASSPSGNDHRGYLYFPPGRYFLGRPDRTMHPPASIAGGEFGDIVVPPEVTLWFAPGAILVPMAGAGVAPRQFGELNKYGMRIEIYGDIIAERRQIFSLWVDENAMGQRAGVVLLQGDRIREVYPEWWGAAAELDWTRSTVTKNTAAIQAAIDAAYHNRVSPKRERDGSVSRAPGTNEVLWNVRPSIPIVMMGQYFIDREIHVGVSSDWNAETAAPWSQPPLSGFEIEGERAMGGSGSGVPTLRAVENFNGRALLAIRGPTTFSIRNMTFNGLYEVRSCVTVETIDATWGSAIFDGCSFLRACKQQSNPAASTALVVLDAESRRRAARPGASSANAPRDFWNVSFKRCLFSPGDFGRSSSDANSLVGRILRGAVPDVANNVVGVEVRLGDNEGLEFRECIFRDAGSPGIRAFSGRFAMRNCLMHMSRPTRLSPDDPLVHPEWLQPDHPHGADIIIEPPQVSNPGSRIMPLLPASFTLNTHMSHSWQLFAAKGVPAGSLDDCKPSPVVLMDVKNVLEGSAGLASARELDPPSVFWPADGPGSIGAPLVLIGCEFVGLFTPGLGRVLTPEEETYYYRVVVVGGGLTGPVFNIGTQLFRTPNINRGEYGGDGLTEAIRGTSDAIDPPVRQLRPRVVG